MPKRSNGVRDLLYIKRTNKKLTSIDFLDGGLGIAMVGVGVEPRLEEPARGGRAGGVEVISLFVSLNSPESESRNF